MSLNTHIQTHFQAVTISDAFCADVVCFTFPPQTWDSSLPLHTLSHTSFTLKIFNYLILIFNYSVTYIRIYSALVLGIYKDTGKWEYHEYLQYDVHDWVFTIPGHYHNYSTTNWPKNAPLVTSFHPNHENRFTQVPLSFTGHYIIRVEVLNHVMVVLLK